MNSLRPAATPLFGFALLVASPVLLAQTTVTFTDSHIPNNTAIDTGASGTNSTLSLASGNATHTGTLSGVGGIIKAGAGTLTLSGTSTYTGPSAVNAGTLVLSHETSSPTFTIASGATLALHVPTATRFNPAATTFTGTGTLAKTGEGVMRWDSPVVTFALSAGSLDVQAGTLIGGSFGNDVWTNNLSGLNVASGALFNGSQANVRVAALTGAGTIRSGYNGAGYSAFTFGLNNASGTFSGQLADFIYPDTTIGPGNFIKTGTGTQILSGNNTYTGTTTISGGTLQIGAGDTSGSLASSSIINNAALVFDRSDAVQYSGKISGTGTLTKQGAGTLTLSGTNPYTGTTIVSAGTLTFTGPAAFQNRLAGDWTAADLTVESGATAAFRVGGSGAFRDFEIYTLGQLGTATTGFKNGARIGLDTTGGDFDLGYPLFDPNGGANSLGLVKLGPNTLTLSGPTSYTGPTIILGGTLAIANGDFSFPSILVSPGTTLYLAGNFSASGLTLRGTISGGVNGRLFTAPDAVFESGTIDVVIASTGGSGLTKTTAGTLVLTRANTYSGTTTLQAGTLQLSGAGTLPGAVAINSGATLSLQRSDAFGGHTAANANAITVAAGGLVTNAGASVFNTLGALTLNGGELRAAGGASATWPAYQLKGTVTVGGTSPSTITSTGVSNTEIQLGSNTAGGATTFQVADVTGSAATDLSISAVLQNGRNASGNSVASGLVKSGAGTLALTADNTFTGTTEIAAGTLLVGTGGATGALAGPIVNHGTLIFNRTTPLTLSGSISGSGPLTHAGSSTLVFTGANDYSGLTTISSGTLQIGDATTTGSLGSGPVANGGALVFKRSNDLSANNTLSGAGTLTQAGAGVLSLGGANTYTGGTTFAAGTVHLASAGALGSTGSLVFSGGTLRFSADNRTDYSARFTSTAAQPFSFDTNNQPIAFAHVLTGAGSSLAKHGAGTLTLAGGDTYTGATTITAGELLLTGTTRSSSFAINSGARLELQVPSGTRDALAATTTFSGPGILRKTGAGSIVWGVNSAVFAFSPGSVIEVQGGNFQAGSHANEDWTNNYSRLEVSSGASFTGAEANVRVDALSGSGLITSGYTGSGYEKFTFGVANGSGTFDGVLANDQHGHVGHYVKAGTGTQTLTGNNTYTGTTTIDGGTVRLTGAGSLYNNGTTAGSIVVNHGGALEFARPDTFGNHTALPLATLTINAGGLVRNTNVFTTLNNLTLNGGELRATGGANAIYPAYQLKGTVTVGGASPSAITATSVINSQIHLGNNTAGGVTTFAIADATGDAAADLTIAAVLQDGRNASGASVPTGLIKTGAGTLRLDAANTFSGVTTITGGTLLLGVTNALGQSTLDTSGAGTLALGSFSSLTLGGLTGSGNIPLVNGAGEALALTVGANGASTTFSGALSGAGSLRKTGAGILTLTGTNSYSGGTTIAGGRIEFDALARFGSGSVTLDGGGLRWTTGTSTDVSSVLAPLGAGGGTFDTNGNSFTHAAALSGTGGFTKTGEGTLTLTATNTYTGTTTISAGTLRLGNGGTTGSVAGNIGNNAALIFDRSDDFTFPHYIFGSGALTKAGTNTVTLSDADDYTGTMTIAGGTLRLSGGTYFSAPIVNHGTLVLDRSENFFFSSAVSGSGSITQSGSGTVIFSGVHTYTGATTINTGTLRLTGRLYDRGASAGSILVNEGGTLAFGFSNTLGLFDAPIATRVTVNAGGLVTNTNQAFTTLQDLTLAGGELRAAGGASASYPAYQLKGTVTVAGTSASSITTTGAANSQIQLGNNTALGSTTFAVADVTSDASSDLTISAVLQNGRSPADAVVSSGLIKSGAGTLTLNAANTFTGVTRVDAGTLVLGVADALAFSTFDTSGAGTLSTGAFSAITLGGVTGSSTFPLVAASSGPLALSVGGGNASTTFAGSFTGAGSLRKIGSGVLTLSSANHHSGGTTVAAGYIEFAAVSAFGSGSVTLDGGGLRWATGTSTNVSSVLAPLGAGGGTFHTNNNSFDLDFALSGAGGFTKTGDGRLTVTVPQAYTGNTRVTGGELRLAVAGALGQSRFDPSGGGALGFASHFTEYTLGGFTGDSGSLSLTNAAAAPLALSVGAGDVSSSTGIAFTGSGSLIKVGAGTLTLTGNNTHAGETVVRGGTLAFSGNGSVYHRGTATGTIIVEQGGTLSFLRDDTFGNNLAVPASTVTIGAGGLVTNAGANVFNTLNNLQLNGGELHAAGGKNATYSAYHLKGTVSVGGTTSSTITSTGAANSEIQLGNNTSLGSTTFAVADVTGNAAADLTISAVLENGIGIENPVIGPVSSGLRKTGAGTLVLTGNNTFTSTVTITEGTLQLGNGGDSGRLNTSNGIANQGALVINRSGSLTHSGVISGTGSVTKTGSGTFTLSGSNTYTGVTTVDAGTLALSGSGSLYTGGTFAGSIQVNSGGTLAFARSNAFGNALATPAATVTVAAGGLATNSGAFFNTLGNLTLNGGELRAAGGSSSTFPAFQLKGTVTAGGTSASSITTTGASNSQIQLGNNTAGGVTTFNVVDATSSPATDLTLSAILQDGRSSAGGNPAVASGLTKTGTGTLLLSGAHTYTGPTLVNAGTLLLAGSLTSPVTVGPGATFSGTGSVVALTVGNGGTVSPGASPGTLTVNGAATFAAGGTFTFELNNALGTAGTNWDLLSVSGSLAITATPASKFTLDLVSLTALNAAGAAANFDASLPYSFNFVTATGGISGFNTNAFAVDTSAFQNAFSGTWSIAASTNALALTYSPSAIPEPSTYAALAGLAALAVALHRRRTASKPSPHPEPR
jgi:autotransporter-associated beta strand protein